MINLGDKVRDEVSGFEGIALARLEGLYEATQIRVHPTKLDPQGQIITSVWFEEDRLVVLKERAVVGFVNVSGKMIGESVCIGPKN